MANPDYTIAIWTFNRHHCLDRIVKIYAGRNLIIADGSPIPYREVTDPCHIYLHLPGISPQDRIRILIDTVYTSHIILVADDDILDVGAVGELSSAMLSNQALVGIGQIHRLTFGWLGSPRFENMYDPGIPERNAKAGIYERRLVTNDWQAFNYLFDRSFLSSYFDGMPEICKNDFIAIEELLKVKVCAEKAIISTPKVISYRNKYSQFNSTRNPQCQWLRPAFQTTLQQWFYRNCSNTFSQTEIEDYRSLLYHKLTKIRDSRYRTDKASYLFERAVRNLLYSVTQNNPLTRLLNSNCPIVGVPRGVEEELQFRFTQQIFWRDAD
jgi:hypothetical protein